MELFFNKASPLMKKLTEATSPEEKIKVLFFSILNREPTKEELKMCMAELSGSNKINRL